MEIEKILLNHASLDIKNLILQYAYTSRCSKANKYGICVKCIKIYNEYKDKLYEHIWTLGTKKHNTLLIDKVIYLEYFNEDMIVLYVLYTSEIIVKFHHQLAPVNYDLCTNDYKIDKEADIELGNIKAICNISYNEIVGYTVSGSEASEFFRLLYSIPLKDNIKNYDVIHNYYRSNLHISKEEIRKKCHTYGDYINLLSGQVLGEDGLPGGSNYMLSSCGFCVDIYNDTIRGYWCLRYTT